MSLVLLLFPTRLGSHVWRGRVAELVWIGSHAAVYAISSIVCPNRERDSFEAINDSLTALETAPSTAINITKTASMPLGERENLHILEQHEYSASIRHATKRKIQETSIERRRIPPRHTRQRAMTSPEIKRSRVSGDRS